MKPLFKLESNKLIHPTRNYISNLTISHFKMNMQYIQLIFHRLDICYLLQMEDNFQKQTNRNRMYIYSPNGVQMLNIPIKHSKKTSKI